MQIFVNSIAKKQNDFKEEIEKYIKMSKNFATLSDNIYFSNNIAKAQSSSRAEALKAYDELYFPKLKSFNIALDERGKKLDSFAFAELINNKASLSFFIGGAYGLSEEFKNNCDIIFSLSALTMAHPIAKLVLFEQIFRALAINNSHPYHK